MKEKEKNDEKKKKKIPFQRILCTFSLVISIAYLTYGLIKVDNILTSIKYLSIPLFIFIINIFVFMYSIKEKKKKPLLLILPIILILFIGFNFMDDISIIKLPQDEKTKSYENMSYKTFNEWAKKNEIELEVSYEYSDTIEIGNIIRTDVNVGTLVKEIEKIKVVVSDGPDYDKIVVVPSMIGQNIDEVIKFIEKNYMSGAIVEFVSSDDEKDTVIKQSKNGDIRRNQEFILTVSLGSEDLNETIEMIDLKNMTLFNATLWLKRNNIKFTTESEFSDSISKNIVLKQNIDKGETINASESSVIITVSKGKAIIVPNILNMTVDEITNWIITNKLKVEFNEIYDENIETGKIIEASVKEKDKIEAGTLISVTISKGQIKMQSFNSLYEFKEWANKYNILYSENYEYSNTISKGSVISYSYNENEIIDPDGVIYIKVSLGKAITIPSFIGKSKSEAQNTCNNIGIRCSFTTGTYTEYKENVIYNQSRSNGTKVASGTTITLTLSKGIPVTKNLYIQQNWLSIGNADATITSLQKQFASNFPGVNFKFIKVKDNTLSSGMISKSSPTNHGTQVKQGNTYTINVVSN